ncbi:hypothetical protein ACFCYB_13395 [Streptomyces sp. NPDC056309]|uniref:hypothetical protein n=1 Tax=unclassified Streptomyces TaxID=2593676 RepID=UPI0035D6AB29
MIRFDVRLRLGSVGVPSSAPDWATDDDYVTYRARPEAAVRDRHQHGGGPRRPPSATGVVRLDAVPAGRARARDDDRKVTFSERGNIQPSPDAPITRERAGIARAPPAARELGCE